MYVFENILGCFVFDEHLKIVATFDSKENAASKYKDADSPDEKILPRILEHFRSLEFHEKFHNRNISMSRDHVKNSVNNDTLLSQAVNSSEELERVTNSLAKRLREWYELYNPEASASVEDHHDFVKKILSSSKKQILQSLNVDENESLGADLESKDSSQILSLAEKIESLYAQKEKLLEYISEIMEKHCPNIKAVAGQMIGARLLEHAGSLKRLSEMPSSTIQILGAETALFRHLKTGARPPRHGLIANHPLISKSKESLHGKIARALADKISIAAKVDYFKGDFIGDDLKLQLEEKVGKMK